MAKNLKKTDGETPESLGVKSGDDLESSLNDLKKKAAEKTPKTQQPTRDAKEAQSQLEGFKISSKMIDPLINFIDKIARAKYGEQVALEPDEKTSLSTYSAIVLTKHLPDVMGRFAEEITLLILICSITATKALQYDSELKPDYNHSGEKGERENPPDSE